MSGELLDSLERLEALLTREGAAIVSHLRPGLDAHRVGVLLSDLGLRPSGELCAWYGWHDGAGEIGMSNRLTALVPDGEFYDLESMCREYTMQRGVATSLFSGSDALWEPEQWWPHAWFPILRLFGKGDVVVDLAGGDGEVSPVHAFWHDSGVESRARVLWPSVHAFVEDMIHRFETGAYWIDEYGFVETEVVNIDDSA